MREIEGSSVLILGYGAEGKSTHRYIAKKFPDKKVSISALHPIDVAEDLPKPQRLIIGENYLNELANFDVVIRSPGISPAISEISEARKKGIRITSETNIFFSDCPGMIIGITGTKGKSTTSSLIANILHQEYEDVRLVGNIGKPALDYLEGATQDTLFVAELSSHQLEDVRYSPHIAVILAIYQEHLAYHGGFPGYLQAKENIVRFQENEDIVIFNPTHPESSAIAKKSKGRKFSYSTEKRQCLECFVDQKALFYRPGLDEKAEHIIDVRDIPLVGQGNIENVLASASVGIILGIQIEKIRKAIMEFQPLEHRMEFVGEYRGIRYYNDSLATIPEATINAMDALGEDVETLILGGFDRGVDYSSLANYLATRKGLKNLILFPTTGQKVWEKIFAITQGKTQICKFETDSMLKAVQFAAEKTEPGKICLLSPASASFNVFKNYKERGNLFKKFVRAL